MAELLSVRTYGSSVPAVIAATSKTHSYQLVAVFEHSAYLSLEGNLFCVAPERFPRGPVTICLARSDWLRFSAFCCSADVLQQCIELHFDCGSAEPWCPSPLPRADQVDKLVSSIKSVAHLAPEPSLLSLADCSLAESRRMFNQKAVRSERADAATTADNADTLGLHLRSFFRRVIARITAMCYQPKRFSPDEQLACLLPLLGAGHGLTPAGDDCVAGLLIGLRIAGWQNAIDFWRPVLFAEIANRTHPISARLLQEACTGRVDESIETVLDNLCSEQPGATASAARQLSAIGHSSGWDFAAGLYIGLRAAPTTFEKPVALSITQPRTHYA